MNDFTNQAYDNPVVTRDLYEAITNLIYDYICFHRNKDELHQLPNSDIVNHLRYDTMLYLKKNMDLLIEGWRDE